MKGLRIEQSERWLWLSFQGMFSPLFSRQQKAAIQTGGGGSHCLPSRHRAHLFSAVYLSPPSLFPSPFPPSLPPSRGFKHGRVGDWEPCFRSIPVGEINSYLNDSRRKVLICMHLSVNQRCQQSRGALLRGIIYLSNSFRLILCSAVAIVRVLCAPICGGRRRARAYACADVF